MLEIREWFYPLIRTANPNKIGRKIGWCETKKEEGINLTLTKARFARVLASRHFYIYFSRFSKRRRALLFNLSFRAICDKGTIVA